MSRIDRQREFLIRNPGQIREVEDRTDSVEPVRGQVYGYTHYDVSVCWSRIPATAGHANALHCIRHGDVQLDDPDFVLIGDPSGMIAARGEEVGYGLGKDADAWDDGDEDAEVDQ